jgi:methylase of polypeptide subunit release factors
MFLRLNALETLTAEQEERYRSLLLLRAGGNRCTSAGNPLLLRAAFRGGRTVLIPRQETETLCELAVAFLKAAGDAPRRWTYARAAARSP